MKRASLIIALVMGVLTVVLWALVNRPSVEPPWPSKVQGFCFSPMRADQSPSEGLFPSVDEIDEDLALLEGDAYAVRTYSVESTLSEIPRLAAAHGLNVTLGAWISRDAEKNKQEIQRLIEIFRESPRQVVRVIVGNETLLRKEQTVEQMIAHVKRVKDKVWAPVSIAEPPHIWLQNPQLAQNVDFIAIHTLPYWEKVPVDAAVDQVVDKFNEVKKAFPGKPIVIAEVGWPSDGRTWGAAVASRANQAKFLRRFLARAEREGYTYYIMEAFDQIWKRRLEGAAGAHWGVYNSDREPKFTFTEPIVRIPGWHALAAISIALSVVFLALLLRDSGGLKRRGLGFLALVAYGIATLAVWLVYDYSTEYLTPGTLAVGVALLLAAIGVVIVLLAEAHEWAEAQWLQRWRRMPERLDMPDEWLPFVSVHVPAYNEPPQMMIETLDALAALDYPGYEVVVIDNNTRDPAVWQPVQAHCERLGPRFRFFHVDPLAGFKAGALNFALRETAPRAGVVAVIDSDYLVDPRWLREMVPLFADEKVAVVQAPQDYRDGAENAFKAMCQAEYRGFFHIGMVTRNERDAIIQHGTMTLVRRRVLDEVGGWAEWSITEDAELGLRIFEHGYSAVYVPQSYGKGLMPDTFIDFKKQRFRWAYGAVLILRHHLMALLALDSSRLTRGQRYHFIAGWLPWLADGFNLLFNFAALAWTFAMIAAPDDIPPPNVVFMVLPLIFFGFKVIKMFFLYRQRVAATLRQSIAASLAGLALSHVIARAMVTGLITRRIGFFRTPKQAGSNALLQALLNAREELLLLVAMSLGATGVLLRPDGVMLDTQLWALVLAVQAIPYCAAVLVSLVSGMPQLPSRLVGTMARLGAA